MAIVGIFTVLAMAIYLDKKNILRFLEEVGRHSMPIYVSHSIAVAAVRVFLVEFAAINNPIVHVIFGLLAGVILPYIFYKITVGRDFPYFYQLRKI